jgi:methionyl-tRNA formyltransferase
LRLLFFGTPEFAVPSLRALAASRHPVVGVVSQPDRPRGRGRKLEPTPVHAAAQELSLPIHQAQKLDDAAALGWMRALEPDLGVVVAFGQFIPRVVRELPKHGSINAHGSLLPRHRGASPIAHAILAGDAETGISVIRVAREMDAGPECLRIATPLAPSETAGELAERLAPLAGTALLEAVERIAAGTAVFVEQDHARATLAPKLDRDFGHIDWRATRVEVVRRVHAATPWPGSDAALRKSGRTLRLLRVAAGEPHTTPAPAPGRVDVSAERLRVAALDGWVDVLMLQAPGRRPVAAEEFLRGARIPADEEVVLP